MTQRLLGLLMAFTAPCVAMFSQTGERADTLQRLDEVVVTGQQAEREATSTAPLHRLNQGQMLRMGISDMADALHRLPGITLRDYGGAGGMKTVSVRGFGAKHTGVSYDGVMLSECQSSEIDLSRYSLDNVDHLQLTIGDNDDIFIPARQASTPAVLAIESVRPPSGDDRRPHLTAQMKVGSFGYTSPFIRYEQSLTPRLSLSAVGEYTYAENDYPFTLKNVTIVTQEHRTNSRMNQGHGELNMRWQPDSRNELALKAYYFDNDRQLPGQVRYYTNESNETLRDRNAFGQLQYRLHSHAGWSVKAQAKYNWAASIYRNGAHFGSTTEAIYWQREAYASACVLYAPAEGWAFDYSADYSYNNLNGNTVQMNHPRRHTMLQTLTAKYRSRHLTTMARLLHSLYLNDTKDGTRSARNLRHLSPSLSLSWQPLLSQMLYVRASYKNVFRSPTFNESYFFHYGSADLQPENADQLNMGITYAASLRQRATVKATVDAYLNHVDDMIVAVPYNMFVWTCINVGKVKVLGLDATLSANATVAAGHELWASANYSFQQVENRSNTESPNYGKQIAYYPRNSVGGALAYENPWANVSVHMTAISSRWATNDHLEGTRVKGYEDYGLTVWHSWQLKRHKLEVRADVKNLLDQQYEIVNHYPMPGRSYFLSLKYQF